MGKIAFRKEGKEQGTRHKLQGTRSKITLYKPYHMPMSSSISTRLHYQHKSIVDMIDGLSDEMIRRQVIPGKWSIFENIVHLQTYQHTFCARMKQLLDGSNPTFTRYTAESDPAFLDNCHSSMREIIQDLLSLRKHMLIELTSLNEEDLRKTANHPLFGKMTLIEWLNFFLLHEAHHMFTIFKLSGELKKINLEPANK